MGSTLNVRLLGIKLRFIPQIKHARNPIVLAKIAQLQA